MHAPRPPVDAPEGLRVLQVARPAQIGGTITSTLRQAQAEFDSGRHVQVLSLIQRQRVEFLALSRRYTVPAKLVSEAGFAGRLVSSRFIGRWDIVHVHSARSTLSRNVRLLRTALSPRIPLLVSLHQTSVWDDEPARASHAAMHACASAILVPSHAEREAQIRAGVPAEKAFVVPDIVEYRGGTRSDLRIELALAESTPLVLYCGRIVPEKGPMRLIDAFRIVLAARRDAVLLVAGDGPQLNSCRAAAADLGPNVRFLGHVSEVGRLYASSDVFVAPSTGESFGIAAMEAALAGLPMVLAGIRPWTDVFTRAECCFVDPHDIAGIAETTLRVLDGGDDARAMAQLAQARVRNVFGKEAVLAALTEAYRFAFRQIDRRAAR